MKPFRYSIAPPAPPTDPTPWWFAHAVNHDRSAFDRKLAEEAERIRGLDTKTGTHPHPLPSGSR